MADFGIDISKLPEDVRDKLAELDLELSEGRLVQCPIVVCLHPTNKLFVY